MSYKKKLIGGAARAARSTYTGTALCKDLGPLFPSCLITKLRFSAIVGAHADTSTPTTGCDLAVGTVGNYYSNLFNLWPDYDSTTPIGPLTGGAYGGAAAVSAWAQTSAKGFSPVSTECLGMSRLFGVAGGGAASVYQRMCVLSVKYEFTYRLWQAYSTPDASNDSVVAEVASGPSIHHFHPVSYKDSTITAATSMANSMSASNQPDVKTKLVGKQYGCMSTNHLAADVGRAAVRLDGHTCRWKGVAWPHKMLEIPFTEYVSNESAYGNATTLPQMKCGIQMTGFSPGYIRTGDTVAVSGSMDYGTLSIRAVFTVLFKDFVGSLS